MICSPTWHCIHASARPPTRPSPVTPAQAPTEPRTHPCSRLSVSLHAPPMHTGTHPPPAHARMRPCSRSREPGQRRDWSPGLSTTRCGSSREPRQLPETTDPVRAARKGPCWGRWSPGRPRLCEPHPEPALRRRTRWPSQDPSDGRERDLSLHWALGAVRPPSGQEAGHGLRAGLRVRRGREVPGTGPAHGGHVDAHGLPNPPNPRCEGAPDGLGGGPQEQGADGVWAEPRGPLGARSFRDHCRARASTVTLASSCWEQSGALRGRRRSRRTDCLRGGRYGGSGAQGSPAARRAPASPPPCLTVLRPWGPPSLPTPGFSVLQPQIWETRCRVQTGSCRGGSAGGQD